MKHAPISQGWRRIIESAVGSCGSQTFAWVLSVVLLVEIINLSLASRQTLSRRTVIAGRKFVGPSAITSNLGDSVQAGRFLDGHHGDLGRFAGHVHDGQNLAVFAGGHVKVEIGLAIPLLSEG